MKKVISVEKMSNYDEDDNSSISESEDLYYWENAINEALLLTNPQVGLMTNSHSLIECKKQCCQL